MGENIADCGGIKAAFRVRRKGYFQPLVLVANALSGLHGLVGGASRHPYLFPQKSYPLESQAYFGRLID